MHHNKLPSVHILSLIPVFVLCSILIAFPVKADAAVALKIPTKLGLVGYWSFNEGTSTTAADFSGNHNVGTVTNMSAPASSVSGWGVGRLGKALFFDGVDDYVSVADETILDITSNITVAAWVKVGSFSAQPIVITKGSGSFELQIENTGKVVLSKSGTAVMVRSSSSIGLNVWNHIVGVRNGATSYIYINGVDVSDASSRTDQTFSANSVALTVGAATGGASANLSGAIDEVRIYNRALSSSELSILSGGRATSFNVSRNTSVTDGLIGLWSFDGADMNGLTAYDRSGRGNDATFVSLARVPGRIGQALSFPGTDYAVTSNNIMSNPTGITMSFWMKSGPYSSRIFSVEGAYMVSMGTDGILRAIVDGAEMEYAQTLSSIADNKWHHVLFTHTGEIAGGIIYIDGVASSTFIGSSYSGFYDIDSLDRPVGIGGNPPPNYLGAYTGLLDDVRLYNRVITADEIVKLYRAGLLTKINTSQNNKNQNGLIGLWSFDGPDMIAGTVAYDRSGSGYDGTLVSIVATGTRPGKVGQALYFDGTNSEITIPNLDTYNTRSISVWIKRGRSPASGFDGIIGCSAAGGWGLGIYDYGGAGSKLYDGKIGVSDYRSTAGITDQNWHHVVETLGGGSIKFYIDGVLDSSQAYSDTYNCSNATYQIGNINSNSPKFKGLIDDLRLYNRVLTATEVSTLYNRTK